MRSHSVTCHPAEVTFPPLPQPKLVLDLATQEGCKAELTWVVVISHDSLPAKYGHLSQNSVMARIRTCDRESQVQRPYHYTTKPPKCTARTITTIYHLRTLQPQTPCTLPTVAWTYSSIIWLMKLPWMCVVCMRCLLCCSVIEFPTHFAADLSVQQVARSLHVWVSILTENTFVYLLVTMIQSMFFYQRLQPACTACYGTPVVQTEWKHIIWDQT